MSDQFHDYETLLVLAQTHKTKTALRHAISEAKIVITEAEPLSGYYRCVVVKDGPTLPVAIWRDGDILHVLAGGEPVRLQRVWPHCMWSPVPYDWYEAVTERGERWPDEPEPVLAPVVPADTAEPKPEEPEPEPTEASEPEPKAPEPDEHAKLKGAIDIATETAKQYAVINSDDEAAAAQSVRSLLNSLSTRADNLRDEEKRPHLEKCKAADAKWQPLVKGAKKEADAIRASLKVWTNRVPEPVAEPIPTADSIVTSTHNQPPVEPAPSNVASIKGTTGRAARVVLQRIAQVDDQDAAYAFLRNVEEVSEVIRLVAQRFISAGHDVPGVSIKTEKDVA